MDGWAGELSTFNTKSWERNINDPEQTADEFCDSFTGLGPSLAQKITPSNTSFADFLNNDLVYILFFESTDYQELIKTN